MSSMMSKLRLRCDYGCYILIPAHVFFEIFAYFVIIHLAHHGIGPTLRYICYHFIIMQFNYLLRHFLPHLESRNVDDDYLSVFSVL